MVMEYRIFLVIIIIWCLKWLIRVLVIGLKVIDSLQVMDLIYVIKRFECIVVLQEIIVCGICKVN